MKNFLKKLLVPILASRQVTAVAEKLFESGVPIFMLHRLTPEGKPVAGRISPEHLRKCLDYLVENNFSLITLEQLILALQNNTALPAKPIVFTMDDGYDDQAEIAAPIFIEYNCPLTFFIITGMPDEISWPWDAKISWLIETSTDSAIRSSSTIKDLRVNIGPSVDKRVIRRSIQEALKTLDAENISKIVQKISNDTGITIPDAAPPGYKSMTWSMARKLEEQGIRFAPHSVSHHILSHLDDQTAQWEIEQSWKTIKTELKNPLKVFCYPNGRSIDFGDREIAILKSSNFLGAVSATPNFIKHTRQNTCSQIYSLPRLPLPSDMIDFVKYCSWFENIKT